MGSMETKIKELIKKLNYHTNLYDMGKPEISDREWDDMYFELKKLEEEYQIFLPNSPTQSIHWEIKSELVVEKHDHPMLSLDKTKSLDKVQAFLGEKEYLAMLKMDGLSLTLRYENGKLVSARTRGNDGLYGENVTHNAKMVRSIPNVINYKDTLVVDGEIICKTDDFEEFSDDYANTRNFAVGSIRLLDARECSNRNLTFVAWDVIEGFDGIETLKVKLEMLKHYNFTIVPFITSRSIKDLESLVDTLPKMAKLLYYPIDGLVFKFNDLEYSKTLGATAHHKKNAIAYKFYDEAMPTKLINIEWTMGRTGALTPVAVFETIELEGTDVSRANLHNLSIMRDLLGDNPCVGQTIYVYKANQIIPQVEHSDASDGINVLTYPTQCPLCSGDVVVQGDLLICNNPDCEGKLINRLDHFCGKKGLDIKGLSKMTLSKLIDQGWVNNFSDIFNLNQYAVEWANLPGFGKKSVEKILLAIENGKTQTLDAFISAIGIPLIGRNVAKELAKQVPTYEYFREKVDEKFDFSEYPGFAESKTCSLLNYDYTEADKLAGVLTIAAAQEEEKKENTLDGKTIVITGRLNNFKNRASFEAEIKAHGGKTASSVTGSTDYLVNNDSESKSSKNLTAKKNGIPILTEEEFCKKFLTK